jgi:hypothetical protein
MNLHFEVLFWGEKMTKRILLALVLSVLTAGVVFSQTDFKGMAKNTITVDIGPTIVGATIGGIGNLFGGSEGLSSSGFGIGAQYERQILQKLSVAGRFAYLGGGVGFSQNITDSGLDASVNFGINISSYSLEGHARFYPGSQTFFLDGMLGYANLTVKFSGSVVVDTGSSTERMGIDLVASQGFFKMGAKIGWRITFGKNGGFTFEPSFGYSFGVGGKNTVWNQLSNQIKERAGTDAEIEDDSIGELFDIIQKFVFIGGPRLSLALGWRF